MVELCVCERERSRDIENGSLPEDAIHFNKINFKIFYFFLISFKWRANMSRMRHLAKFAHVAYCHVAIGRRVYQIHVTHCVTWAKTRGCCAACYLATSLYKIFNKIKIFYIIYTI